MTRRHNLNISEGELKEYLQVIEESFKMEWLSKKGSNLVQKLWKREDELATIELFILAKAIKELKVVDKRWIENQIKVIKKEDENNTRGAIFEILALSIFNSSQHPVQPSLMNQPGFDGILSSIDGKKTRLSIKSYGKSTLQQRFEKRAKEFETKLIEKLKLYKYPSCQIILDFLENYPEDKDWKFLTNKLDEIIQQQLKQTQPFTAYAQGNSKGILMISLYPFNKKTGVERLHPDYLSYTLMISAAFHKNEILNLCAKINEACYNLTKHAKNETDKIFNGLMMHIPDSLSLDYGFSWLDEYFKENPDKPISQIFFYQPVAVEDLTSKAISINHCLRIYNRKGRRTGCYNFNPPAGFITKDPASLLLVANYEDGNQQTFPIENRYIYQSGKHYIKMQSDGKGGYQASLKRIGSGIHENFVLEIPGQKGQIIINEKLPPKIELLII